MPPDHLAARLRLVAFTPLLLAASCGGGASSGGGGAAAAPPPPDGRALFEEKGCAQCHEQGTGASISGLYGWDVTLKDGKKVKVDDAYLRAAILQPASMVRENVSGDMPSYEGKLTEAEIAALVTYLRTYKR